jgi:hypothetical protein
MSSTQPLPEAKGQHYIPKFYLKGFTDINRVLWVYKIQSTTGIETQG